MTSARRESPPLHLSVVCPFYNEARIIEQAVLQLLEQLATLDCTWELIVVDDGSTDGSRDVVRPIAARRPELRLLGYTHNRGRGHALRTGIAAARGDVIVTTEIDLSWGTDIVHRLLQAMHAWPDAHIVVASPHLPGGGYRNVPSKRVFFSRFGNRVIRACMGDSVTMNTGMTRAYRREVIQSLPLIEDGKEFHLEVILKATSFGFRIREIPTLLEWKEYKHSGRRVARKSSSSVGKLVVSHSLFSLFANPIRYVWAMALGSFAFGVAFFLGAVVLFALGRVSVYTALMSVSLILLSLVLFVMGVVLKQGFMVQRELWILQRYQVLAQGPGMLLAELSAPPDRTVEGGARPSASRTEAATLAGSGS
ncbi:MAG TPA: glycosyltransferase family 2 protein [Longimicrobiales bacterium]|nr:glycosyltransferase family 2 protein [Longimicrobiales bacterium]